VTPAARVQAAIEIVDLILAAARDNGPAADRIIADWFKTRRFAGSKDRRAVRDHIYAVIRAFGDPPASGRAGFAALPEFRPLFDGSPHGPAALTDAECEQTPSAIPGWLAPRIPTEEHTNLLERAPFDLRANSLRTSREKLLSLFPGAEPISVTPHGLRLPEHIPLANRPELNGLLEVQDAGSQLVALACAAQPGQLVVDLCAGAGGKTLALAADMAGEGRLLACDTDRGRLSKLEPRAQLAGASFLQARLLNPKREMEALDDIIGQADCVLIDAPCSGTGTWRRNPELRWRLIPQRLKALIDLQAHILDLAAPLVRDGGGLVYAVCSILEDEGANQIAAFLSRHPAFRPVATGIASGRASGHGLILTPHHDSTDGFFIARLEKTC
jgi:16S rRNA (cytosine967-C5)-methyltransferase